MHGSMPLIGISTLVYGLVGLCGLTAWAGSTVRTRVRSNGGAHHGEPQQ